MTQQMYGFLSGERCSTREPSRRFGVAWQGMRGAIRATLWVSICVATVGCAAQFKYTPNSPLDLALDEDQPAESHQAAADVELASEDQVARIDDGDGTARSDNKLAGADENACRAGAARGTDVDTKPIATDVDVNVSTVAHGDDANKNKGASQSDKHKGVVTASDVEESSWGQMRGVVVSTDFEEPEAAEGGSAEAEPVLTAPRVADRVKPVDAARRSKARASKRPTASSRSIMERLARIRQSAALAQRQTEPPSEEITVEIEASQKDVEAATDSLPSDESDTSVENSTATPEPQWRSISKPITDVSVNIAAPAGLMPENKSGDLFTRRPAIYFDSSTPDELDYSYMWVSPAFCHGALYFEQPNLERYGHSIGCLQPVLSGAYFFVNIPAMPYRMVVERPCQCYFYEDYGVDCIGAPAPVLPACNLAAGVAEAAVMTGLVFLIP